MDHKTNHLFCFGLGYTAQALAETLAAKGWQIAGTSRDPAALQALSERGIDAFRFDRDHPLDSDGLAALARASHVLSSVPPDTTGDPVLARHAEALAALAGIDWVGYLSTTGVYGDRGGDWVDEETKIAPTTERGKRRANAEAGWRRLHDQAELPVHVFRLAGIYGPGRNQLEALRQDRARRIDKPGQVFSRIHLTDIVAVLEASMAAPRPGAIYNLADDEAAAPGDVIAFAAELLGLPAPPIVPYEDAELSPMAQSFYAENKRVRNNLIKTEFAITLGYPTYREGLRALLATCSG